jgi:hypothetical protein
MVYDRFMSVHFILMHVYTTTTSILITGNFNDLSETLLFEAPVAPISYIAKAGSLGN